MEDGEWKMENGDFSDRRFSFLICHSPFSIFRFRFGSRLFACSLAAWFFVILVIDGRLLFGPLKQSVYPTFARAGLDWRDGQELYEHKTAVFRYSPLVAALLAPFSLLPERMGELAWRLLNGGVFLGALLWWARTCLPRRLTSQELGALLLLALPLSIGSLNNAQCNPLVLALLLLACGVSSSWNLAAAALALAAYFKIYPLAIGLLLAAVFPRQLGWRLALALLIGAAIPFALQRPDYVASEYVSWFHYLRTDTRIDVPLGGACRDLRLLFRLWHIPVGPAVYTVIQLSAAAGIAALCLLARRAGWPQRQLLTSLLAWGCCWMLLLGPATESCTYILLAPSLAWATLDGFTGSRPLGARLILGGSLALFGVSLVANWFPIATAVHSLGPQPLGALCFAGYLAWTDFPRLRASATVSEEVQATGNFRAA
jgi:hypothetical protein